MVIDSSAFVAILKHEAEAVGFLKAIETDPVRLIGGPTMLEVLMVSSTETQGSAHEKAWAFVNRAAIEILPFDNRQVRWAARAFDQFGKGQHRARLNFGDCMAYAASKATDEPLLFKGADFGMTDVSVHPASVRLA